MQAEQPPEPVAAAPDLQAGFIPTGTVVTGVRELERLLTRWTDISDRATLGDTGAYGGAPVVTVRMTVDEFILNRDTTRAAIRDFLATAAWAGGAANLTWRVIPNARGRCNKVSYSPDSQPAHGWYAYLRQQADYPYELH
jgi:hypothetical protein